MTDTTNEAPELLPCPFCGSGPAIERQNATFGVQLLHDFSSELHWVHCGTCGAKCGWGETEDQASAAWNTRADLVQAAVAAALREAAKEATARGYLSYEDILSFITPDAQAVLDRVVAAAKQEGMVDAANIIGQIKVDDRRVWVVLDAAQDLIRAAIREGGE